eukprot:TRINITY_DN23229_c1_g1_i1.p1 TRINITY_DN23229_c1_g1~~TRINITY_DN23229_c1_g1_i1.p1  ORF type:complete len:369 (-),score=31.46 TRINITY_DN23229_c1_g1_i1:310-1335(-)
MFASVTSLGRVSLRSSSIARNRCRGGFGVACGGHYSPCFPVRAGEHFGRWSSSENTSHRATPKDSTRIPTSVAIPVGMASGLLGSLCGIGGGLVIIPSLTASTNLAPHTVAAASMFCVSVASFTGAASYLEQGFTNVPLALVLMSTSIPACMIGAKFSRYISGPALKKLSGLAMILAAFPLWLKAGRKDGNDVPHEARIAELRTTNKISFSKASTVSLSDATKFVLSHLDFVALGVATGLAGGIIGIGGGLVMNTYMGYFTEMPQHEIIATSLLVAVPLGASASLVHYFGGRLNPRSCIILAGTAFLAMSFTSRFAERVEHGPLQRLFSCMLVVSGVGMMR